MRTFFFLLLPQVIDFPCSRLYLIQRLPFSIILDLKQSLVFDTATTFLNHPRPQAVACIRYSDYFSQSSSTSSSPLYSIQRLPFFIILDLNFQAVACIRYSDYLHYRSSTSWLGLCVSPPCLELSQPPPLDELDKFRPGQRFGEDI